MYFSNSDFLIFRQREYKLLMNNVLNDNLYSIQHRRLRCKFEFCKKNKSCQMISCSNLKKKIENQSHSSFFKKFILIMTWHAFSLTMKNFRWINNCINFSFKSMNRIHQKNQKNDKISIINICNEHFFINENYTKNQNSHY